MQATRGKEVYLLLILDLGTGGCNGVFGQRHSQAEFCSWEKEPWNPLDKRMGGPQSWSGPTG
jgi:hypothetical protein